MNIWVNGTFDVLHRGHLELLEYASQFGVVRVGIDTDERVKEKKGSNRPVNSLNDRMYNMLRIKGVDSVVYFGSDEELENCIKEWNTDILIVGSDYRDKKVIGSQYSKEVAFFEKIDGFSTTKILEYDKNISNW